MDALTATPHDTVVVERWPSEIPLLVLVALAAAGIWVLLAVSLLGLVYAGLIAAFLFVTHLGFVAHVRGSAVRIGPDQFPELHQRIVELSRRCGLRQPPAAYVMQAGGSLNALATKLFRSRMIVLFSDLLDACGDDTAARDMIVGHELGHIHARHLQGIWFLAPGLFLPFLGAAYSRARERTCDRYGAALCGDRRGAVTGLAILAAGGARARQVNLQAFARQAEDLDTGWMTLVRWLAGYPPLCERIALLEPAYAAGARGGTRGPMRAIGIVALVVAIPSVVGALVVAKVLPAFTAVMEEAARQAETAPTGSDPVALATLRLQVAHDLQRLADFAKQHRAETGAYPADSAAFHLAWQLAHDTEAAPLDPFDGKRYGYYMENGDVVMWSVGPDGESETEDDMVLDVVN